MQQINLYQPIFRKEKIVFSALAMLQVAVVLLVILSAIYTYNLWQLQPFENQIKSVTSERQRLTSQIEKLKSEIAANAKSQLLEDELKRVKAELARKRKIQSVLSEGSFGNQTGFSTIWEGLARQHISGLWLTKIKIENGGQKLTLNGKTISAELVPVYIQKLSTEAAFSGISFNVLELSRDEENPSVISFNLGTARDKKS